jgi:hypothetical protein
LQDYNLKPIGRCCATNGQELVPGSLCHSVLLETNGELQRLDFSAEGWGDPPAGMIAHWRCVVPEPMAVAKKPLDPQELMRQFEQLSEEANPAREKFRYVLALLLIRQRRLKLEGTRVLDDEDYLEVSGTRGEGTFLVRDQQLDESELQELQSALVGRRSEPNVAA